MDIKYFFSQYKNHPVLFIGAGISLRYLKNSFNWDGLLLKISLEIFENEEAYLYIKSKYEKNGEFDYTLIGRDLEKAFNDALAKERHGKFKDINDEFYSLMKSGVNVSRFKIYISYLLKNYQINELMEQEISEFKKTRKNIGSIITTNYDEFIEELFDFEPLIGNNILLSNPYGSVYKIHGCITDPLKIIITSADYEKFTNQYELIRAQLLSLFIHNPIIFFGYNVGDENIKSLLATIFTYVDANSDISKKIRQNFLLVEYEKGSESLEISDYAVTLDSGSTIIINKIKTDNYAAIYKELGELKLPVSAMDVRKVQNIVQEIYAGGNIGVKITEDLDSLDNSDKILAIGSSKTIQYHYQTANQTMANYFSVIEEANSHIIKLIDNYNIQKNQFFPIFGFHNINQNISSYEKLKKQQIAKLATSDDSVPDSCKNKYNSIDEIISDPNLAHTNKLNTIYYCFRSGQISLDDCENYLRNHPDKSKTDYRKLLCAFDYKKYAS